MPEATDSLRRAYDILGLEPGVSPFKARRRYLQLIKQWHPDLHRSDAQAEGTATRKTQEITQAYRQVKEAARRGDVPLRKPRAPARSAAETSAWGVVDHPHEWFLRFCVGGAIGLVVNLVLLADSWVLWGGLPVVLGLITAIAGWSFVERALRALWWLV